MTAHKNPLALRLKNPVSNFLLQRITALPALAQVYGGWLQQPNRPDADDPNKALKFLDYVLDQDLKVALALDHIAQDALAAIPSAGPLVIVSNHPLGALEGMLLSRLLLRVRPDLKVLANEQLLRIPEFDQLFVGVDVLAGDAQQRNSGGIRKIHQHLAQGGAALIFPAGTVSVLERWHGQIADAPWHPMVARLALKHAAACVPLFVHAENKRGFYRAGLIHKRLRTALLGRALLSQRGKTIPLSVGKTIDAAELSALGDASSVIQYLRVCSDQLGRAHLDSATQLTPLAAGQVAAIRGDVPKAQLLQKLDQLAQFVVAEHRDFAVYCAPYAELGCVMEQIAISREHTFREVAEGSGKELDEDRFDPYYWHLWIWDRKAEQLVGGYRIKKVDPNASAAALDQLYSRSLYHYDRNFLQQLGKAIEVGRSFVCPAYQRQPHALDLLWKGIGAFVVQNPGYPTLFGCVSISKAYSHLARQLLAETFLFHYGADVSIRKSVSPTAPLPSAKRTWDLALLAKLIDIPILNKLIGRISDGRSIPILVRHYLALNGKFISFTVNHDFNQSLDGLILVDLRRAPEKYIDRYLGESGAAAFREQHGVAHVA
jgi:putative hemolysin